MNPVFLMISRLLYDKGYDEFVSASVRIKSEFPRAVFWLLGPLDLEVPNHVSEERLQADIQSGKIEYLGYQTDVRPIIGQADCVVLPSFYNEGLSRVLMEAMAMKKIIVTTNIPGCREAVEDSRNGFLCVPRNIDSLTEALRKVIRLTPSEKEKMGEEGRKKAEVQFDISKVIEVYHNISDEFEIKI